MQNTLSIEFFMVSAFGGLVGTYFMDLVAGYLRRWNISSGTSHEIIGRWFLYMLKGQFKHKSIANVASFSNEKYMGIFFHYIIAGIGIALLYPFFVSVLNVESDISYVLLGAIFGILTNIFPWLWMMPSFGWGIAGIKKEPHSNSILAPFSTHLAFGLGLGLTPFIYSKIGS